MDRLGYYRTLGVNPQASAAEIKSAYKKLALKYHTDSPAASNALKACKTDAEREELKKSMNEKFSQASAAYEILSNAERRRKYDTGEDQMDGFSFGAGGANEFFNSFFQGGFGGSFGGRRQKERKMPTKKYSLQITLLDIIKQSKITKTVTRKLACTKCNASGSKNSKTCTKCKGAGAYIEVTRAHNTCIQHQVECNQCKGEGIEKSGPACPDCKGQGTTTTTAEHTITIEPGMMDGDNLLISGAGDTGINMTPGDIVFVVKIQEDRKWHRLSRTNLFIEQKLPLYAILTQDTFQLTTLDNRTITIQIPDTHKMDFGRSLLRVPGEGLPASQVRKGDLIIRIIPEMPSLTQLKSFGESLTKHTPHKYNPDAIPASLIDKEQLENLEREEEQQERSRSRSRGEESDQQQCVSL
ncbi:heat shock protein beta-6 [Nematocida sp. AWRm80]|nr:heat shock protein beta-6 [Nematocida sp. AWRm80]